MKGCQVEGFGKPTDGAGREAVHNRGLAQQLLALLLPVSARHLSIRSYIPSLWPDFPNTLSHAQRVCSRHLLPPALPPSSLAPAPSPPLSVPTSSSPALTPVAPPAPLSSSPAQAPRQRTAPSSSSGEGGLAGRGGEREARYDQHDVRAQQTPGAVELRLMRGGGHVQTLAPLQAVTTYACAVCATCS